jgi:hypothetical protein
MEIRKTILQVTVLSDKTFSIGKLSLADIGYQIDEGECLGQIATISEEFISNPALILSEQEALGNDGTFFLVEEDDETP